MVPPAAKKHDEPSRIPRHQTRTGQEQATMGDEGWEGRCAAEAVHLALDYAGHLSPALARFLATVQQKGVPLSPLQHRAGNGSQHP